MAEGLPVVEVDEQGVDSSIHSECKEVWCMIQSKDDNFDTR